MKTELNMNKYNKNYRRRFIKDTFKDYITKTSATQRFMSEFQAKLLEEYGKNGIRNNNPKIFPENRYRVAIPFENSNLTKSIQSVCREAWSNLNFFIKKIRLIQGVPGLDNVLENAETIKAEMLTLLGYDALRKAFTRDKSSIDEIKLLDIQKRIKQAEKACRKALGKYSGKVNNFKNETLKNNYPDLLKEIDKYAKLRKKEEELISFIRINRGALFGIGMEGLGELKRKKEAELYDVKKYTLSLEEKFKQSIFTPLRKSRDLFYVNWNYKEAKRYLEDHLMFLTINKNRESEEFLVKMRLLGQRIPKENELPDYPFPSRDDAEKEIKSALDYAQEAARKLDQVAGGSEVLVRLYTRHPMDVVRMSDVAGTNSCHSLPTTEEAAGGYFHNAVLDALSGNSVIYILKVKDLYSYLGLADFKNASTEEAVKRINNKLKDLDMSDQGKFQVEIFKDKCRPNNLNKLREIIPSEKNIIEKEIKNKKIEMESETNVNEQRKKKKEIKELRKRESLADKTELTSLVRLRVRNFDVKNEDGTQEIVSLILGSPYGFEAGNIFSTYQDKEFIQKEDDEILNTSEAVRNIKPGAIITPIGATYFDETDIVIDDKIRTIYEDATSGQDLYDLSFNNEKNLAETMLRRDFGFMPSSGNLERTTSDMLSEKVGDVLNLFYDEYMEQVISQYFKLNVNPVYVRQGLKKLTGTDVSLGLIESSKCTINYSTKTCEMLVSCFEFKRLVSFKINESHLVLLNDVVEKDMLFGEKPRLTLTADFQSSDLNQSLRFQGSSSDANFYLNKAVKSGPPVELSDVDDNYELQKYKSPRTESYEIQDTNTNSYKIEIKFSTDDLIERDLIYNINSIDEYIKYLKDNALDPDSFTGGTDYSIERRIKGLQQLKNAHEIFIKNDFSSLGNMNLSEIQKLKSIIKSQREIVQIIQDKTERMNNEIRNGIIVIKDLEKLYFHLGEIAALKLLPVSKNLDQQISQSIGGNIRRSISEFCADLQRYDISNNGESIKLNYSAEMTILTAGSTAFPPVPVSQEFFSGSCSAKTKEDDKQEEISIFDNILSSLDIFHSNVNPFYMIAKTILTSNSCDDLYNKMKDGSFFEALLKVTSLYYAPAGIVINAVELKKAVNSGSKLKMLLAAIGLTLNTFKVKMNNIKNATQQGDTINRIEAEKLLLEEVKTLNALPNNEMQDSLRELLKATEVTFSE